MKRKKKKRRDLGPGNNTAKDLTFMFSDFQKKRRNRMKLKKILKEICENF